MAKRKKRNDQPEVFGADEHAPECVVKTEGGRELRCPAFPEECSYVRVTEDDGTEVAYWTYTEWEEDPQEVMGAIIGALKGKDT